MKPLGGGVRHKGKTINERHQLIKGTEVADCLSWSLLGALYEHQLLMAHEGKSVCCPISSRCLCVAALWDVTCWTVHGNVHVWICCGWEFCHHL